MSAKKRVEKDGEYRKKQEPVMSRCDYDSIFYRVFCITLLGIAFTFTVILTNVFIDIDGLLAKKDHGITDKPIIIPYTEEVADNEIDYQGVRLEMQTDGPFTVEETERKADLYGLKPTREEDEESYRTKRSLDIRKQRIIANNPKIKEILNNRLATLLEELDAEETQSTKTTEIPTTTENKEEERASTKNPSKNEAEVLHQAMHNILLQGIIGHMELNDVYTKVHELVNNFEKGTWNSGDTNSDTLQKLLNEKIHKLSQEILHPTPTTIETKFFQELLKCDELQQQLSEAAQAKQESPEVDTKHSWSALKKQDEKEPVLLIRTVIDIKTAKPQNGSKPKPDPKKIKGLIKLIYNGKPIQFSGVDENDLQEETDTTNTSTQKVETTTPYFDEESSNVVDSFLDKALDNYLKKYPRLERNFKNKRRSKRNTKSRRTKNPVGKHKRKKKGEEELYVEIETHFDNTGIKGKKKKQLIKNLVENIQKVIDINMNNFENKEKGKKAIPHIKKRLQNPLETKSTHSLLNKIIIPIDNIILRESEPIGNIVTQKDSDVSNAFKENYIRRSGFLSNAKSINSGEMGVVNLEFDRVLKENGVPQRLQKPLNTDNLYEERNENNSDSQGDMNFYVTDINGSGFSIGFNQYVGEAPDPESIKLFTGIKDLIKEYHKTYDNIEIKNDIEEKLSSLGNTVVKHGLKKRDLRDISEHKTKNKDFHFNEYKVVFDQNYSPYDSNSEVFEDRNKKVSISIVKDNSSPDHPAVKTKPHRPIVLDGKFLRQQLNPSQIFSLANLLKRKKRAINANRRKIKVTKYLNTNKMANFNKKKRNKRQADKIRIIASDSFPRSLRSSDDENVYIISGENVIADRALIRGRELESLRERDIEEMEPDNEQEDQNTYTIPIDVEHLNNPYNIFASRSRQNILMSKYPHVFLEEISQSKEDNNNVLSKLIGGNNNNNNDNDAGYTPSVSIVETSNDDVNQMSNLKTTLAPKPHYKLTVKVIPKNESNLNNGFKEVHTIINKSYNKNGLIYSSQVNVTELSKVENPQDQNQIGKPIIDIPFRRTAIPLEIEDKKINETQFYHPETSTYIIPLVKHIKEQQNKMKELLKLHKQKIDEQLVTLKKEKENIDSVVVMPDEKKLETIDVVLPMNPPQILHLSKAEAGQLISNALMKLHNTPHINDIINAQNMTANTQGNTTPLPYTANIYPNTNTYATNDPDKMKILSTIQRNENLTNAILYKIDRNTDLLQSFLQKISDTLQPFRQNHLEQFNPEQKISDSIQPFRPNRLEQFNPEQDVVPVRKNHYNGPNNYPDHIEERINHDDGYLTRMLPKLQTQKNSTHISVPFIYSYQHKPRINKSHNKPEHEVPSVVLHEGHIHTDAYDPLKDVEVKNTEQTKMIANGTRFFMDETADGLYKFLPAQTGSKTYDIPRIASTNITHT